MADGIASDLFLPQSAQRFPQRTLRMISPQPEISAILVICVSFLKIHGYGKQGNHRHRG